MTPSRDSLAKDWASARAELTNYATRVVLRKDIAEELVQQAAVRLMEAQAPPSTPEGVRAWLFRVVTNLGIDHVRRHSTQREGVMAETKAVATADAEFTAGMENLRGSDEHRAMAREHLSVCFSCTLRVFPAQRAAALLLVEVFDFTVGEAADMPPGELPPCEGCPPPGSWPPELPSTGPPSGSPSALACNRFSSATIFATEQVRRSSRMDTTR